MHAETYAGLLTETVPSEAFVRRALRLLEADLRELALVALGSWQSLGLTAPELYRELAGLSRPSWGRWNGLLTALREARKAVLRSGDPAARERIKQATALNAVLDHLDAEADAALAESLRPLARLVRTTLSRRPRLGGLFALPITLRNDVAHFCPSEPEWWEQARERLRPLVAWAVRGDGPRAVLTPADRREPWFFGGGAFAGLLDRAVLYASPEGEVRPSEEMMQPLLAALNQLFGREELKAANLKRLAERVPDELKTVLLGDFLIHGPTVGRGGFAAVYPGVQVSTGRKVAVKVLHEGLDADCRERFRQEASLLAHFNHPHIVGVIAHGEEPWFPPREPAAASALAREEWFQEFQRAGPTRIFLALEWVEGHTLEEVFQGQRPDRPDAAELTDWFRQAADALTAVHAAGMIHRDVKPSNLMATADGRVLLMDFGIARSQADTRTIRTTAGRALGTPAYMAPEQRTARDPDAEVGPAADVYSLCATFYELFTGARLDEPGAAGVRDRPEPPRRRRPDLSWEIDVILTGGLEPGVAERYRTMSDLRRDLEHVQRLEPIEYRRPSALRRLMLWRRRNPAAAHLTAALAALLLGAAGGAATAAVLINEARGRAEQSAAAERIAHNAADQSARAERDARVEVEHQKGEIERQRDRLQKNLTFARNQVQRYFDLIKRIPRDDLPVGDFVGLLKLRDEMEQVTKEYFEEFEKDSGRPDADLAFYADLAEGLEQLSEISLELGQPEASRATSLDYFKVQERLAQRYPEELKYRTDLAAGYNGMAVASLAVGKENEALDWSQKALDALAALPQEARDSFDVRVQVAKTHSDRGGVYGRLGEPAKAADELLGALDLLKKAEQDDPDMAKFSDLFVTAAKISNNLAKQYFALDDRDKARAILEEAKRSLETDEGKEAADSEDYQVTLGMIELALSAVYEEDKDKEKRGAVLADAVPLWEKLVAEHPRVAQYKVALSHCYLVSAVIAGLEDGRLDDAQAQAQKALEIQKQLDEDDPDFLDAAADAGQTCLTFSGILSSKGRYAEALPWAEDAISRLEAVVQKDDAQKANKTNLAFARRARAEILTELGRYADALAAWDALGEDDDVLPQLRLVNRCICRAGVGDDYLGALNDMMKALAKDGRFRYLDKQAAVFALASAAALKDPDEDLTDADRKKRADRYAAEAVQRLEEARTLPTVYTSDELRRLADSPHFAAIKDYAGFRRFLNEVDEKKP